MLEISVKAPDAARPFDLDVVDVFDLAVLISNTEEVEASHKCKRIVHRCLKIFKSTFTPSTIIGAQLSRVLMTTWPYKGLEFLEQAGVLGVVLPELSLCTTVEQNKKYHIDNVFTHCVKVCSLVEPDLALRWAGLLHDVGKREAFNRTEDGNITFHKHEVHSSKIAKAVLNRMFKDEPFVEEACGLVAMHMYYYSTVWTDKAIRRFILRANISKDQAEDLAEIPLFKLRRADRGSRGLKLTTPKQQVFEARLREFLHKSG